MTPSKGAVTTLTQEFDRQVDNLVQKGYPSLAGIADDEFERHTAPLRERIRQLATLERQVEGGPIPFVVVVKSDLVRAERALSLVGRQGRSGFTTMDAADVQRFRPTADVTLPAAMVYLALDVDTGDDTLDVTPDAAVQAIQAANRSPLTLDEGIAVITHYPEVLRKNHGFSLPGSRCGDRRVTALWIGAGRPRLGWCWAGNPHTWLGSASCARRLG